MSRLNYIHVYIIGAVMALLLGVLLYFVLIKPVLETNTTLRGQITEAENGVAKIDNADFHWNEYDQAQDRLAKATLRKDQKEAELMALESRKQLPPGKRLVVGTTQEQLISSSMPLWINLPRNVVNTLENYAQQSARRHGVKVTANFNAPNTGPDPRQIPKTPLAWTMGPVSVRGSFEKVMNWVRDWNNAPLLVAVDGLKLALAGRRGEVLGTATVTAFVFPDGPGADRLAVPGGAAGGGMGGGMMDAGMMGGGMMGGMDPAAGGAMMGADDGSGDSGEMGDGNSPGG